MSNRTIKQMVSDATNIPEAQITYESKPFGESRLDSLSRVEFVMDIEDECKVTVDPEFMTDEVRFVDLESHILGLMLKRADEKGSK